MSHHLRLSRRLGGRLDLGVLAATLLLALGICDLLLALPWCSGFADFPRSCLLSILSPASMILAAAGAPAGRAASAPRLKRASLGVGVPCVLAGPHTGVVTSQRPPLLRPAGGPGSSELGRPSSRLVAAFVRPVGWQPSSPASWSCMPRRRACSPCMPSPPRGSRRTCATSAGGRLPRPDLRRGDRLALPRTEVAAGLANSRRRHGGDGRTCPSCTIRATVGLEIVEHHDPFTVMAQFDRPVRAQWIGSRSPTSPARCSRECQGQWRITGSSFISFPLSAAHAYLLARHLALASGRDHRGDGLRVFPVPCGAGRISPAHRADPMVVILPRVVALLTGASPAAIALLWRRDDGRDALRTSTRA